MTTPPPSLVGYRVRVRWQAISGDGTVELHYLAEQLLVVRMDDKSLMAVPRSGAEVLK